MFYIFFFSLVDPQSTDYCLVISTKKHFNSLCSAQASKFELPPPQNQDHSQETKNEMQTSDRWKSSMDKYTGRCVYNMSIFSYKFIALNFKIFLFL